jgi:hypothetical protein
VKVYENNLKILLLMQKKKKRKKEKENAYKDRSIPIIKLSLLAAEYFLETVRSIKSM